MRAFTALTVLASLLAAQVPADDQPGTLTAKVSPAKAGSVRVSFHNGTGREVKLNKQVIGSGVLTLQVRDASGKVVAPVPPPVPSAGPEYVTIPAGKEYARSYQLNFFDPPLTAGTYRIRVRLPEWQSNELELRVGGKAD